MTDYAYPVCLDRKIRQTGSYDAGDDETTWTLPITDETIDTIVLSDDFGALAGTIIEGDDVTVSGTAVTVADDYSAGEVLLGRAFTKEIQLSRPYRRDGKGIAYVRERLTLRRIVAHYFRTLTVSIKATMALRSDRTKTFTASGNTRAEGVLKAWFNGNAADMSLYIRNTTPKPSTVTSLEILADVSSMTG